MNSILVLVIVVLSILLILVVLVQKSKGGGLAAGFQGANSTLGAPKTATFLEKASWYIMGTIAALCVICTISISSGSSNSEALQAVSSDQPMVNENVALPEAPAADAPADAPADAEAAQ